MSFTRFPRLSKLLAAASLAALCGLSAAAHAACAIGGNPNSTCGGDQPAAKSTDLPDTGASNPIDIVTGNKYQHETDLAPLPGTLGLQWDRHYNSRSEHQGALGIGWSHAYEAALYRGEDAVIQIRQADGRLIFFRRGKDPIFRPVLPGDGQVEIVGDQYRWNWRDGRKLTFDLNGRLTAVQTRTGEAVFLTYDRHGRLIGLTDPQKRALSFAYDDAASPEQRRYIKSVTGPLGRIGYEYDGWNNLVKATYPDGTSRRYLYDDDYDAHNLTGIIDRSGQRYGTYAYDGNDRAILSTHANGVEKVTLQYERPAPRDGSTTGRTVLTNSLGHRTVYETRILNRVPVILEAHGPGCSTCGKTNVRYGYSKSGQLESETSLDQKGQPIQTTQAEYDALGRPVKLARQTYTHGKPARPVLLQRFEYQGDNPNPTLIAAPSVVPGKERQIRIEYGVTEARRFQPAKVTETGYSPLDADGKPDPAKPALITRATSYGYDDKGRLAVIDGPLAGSADTTRFEYDERGQLVRILYPENRTAKLKYDTVGRVIEALPADGVAARYAYNEAGAVAAVTRAGITQAYRYDVLGHLSEAGTLQGDQFKPQSRYGYDAAGRLLWQAEALGILKRASYDTEGNLLASTVQTRSFEQTERYRYDEFSRLIEVADNTGAVRHAADGNSAGRRPRAASAFRVLRDDFGREVMVAGASHGTLVKRYDEADRLIEQIDDKGDRQTYAYDLSGQRIRHSVIPKTGETQTTTWRHEQGRLAEVKHPNQSERITYNERGQPTVKTVTLKLANGAEAIHITRYAYDGSGALQSQSLPDGTKILFERNGQGQVVAVSRQASPWTLSDWGKTTLVKDLERDLIGLAQVTYGNGIRGQWQRSKEGVLARVVYTRPEGGAVKPSSTAAASNPHALDNILDALLPAAHAQPLPAAANKLPGALGLPADPQALFDARLLYDGVGNVLLQKQQGQGSQATQAYAYDGQSQLIAAQTARPEVTKTSGANPAIVWRYHYDRHGNRVLAQEQVSVTEMGQTRKAAYDPESFALIGADSAREYMWDAQGQLAAIRQQDKELARYRYDHRGLRVSKTAFTPSPASAGEGGGEGKTRTTYTLYNEQRQRIADLDAEGNITRQYIWLGDHLIATLDATQPKPLQAPADGFWQELGQTAQALWNSVSGQADRLAFVHVNHLGAPIAATDEAGQTVWQADYAPYGKLIRTSALSGKSAYILGLRLPGQWEDEESGLYYNDQRYYDPQAGRYLSPDPLGRLAQALGSSNAYAYVNNNPLSYIDPWGLILFAFDGTGNNSNPNWPNPDFTNVALMYGFYDDTAAGQEFKRYQRGIGTDPDAWDITNTYQQAVATQGHVFVDKQLDELASHVASLQDSPETITLDVIGFSRGAALARDFSNLVNANYKAGKYGKHCFEFRFLGLFDTVSQFGINGKRDSEYDFSIAPEWKSVAQAYALNEHRSLFPLRTIQGAPAPYIEKGFVGAHSDVGGGYNTDSEPYKGDLSDVALTWMVQQAEKAGVKFKPIDVQYKEVTNPVVHDQRNTSIVYGKRYDRPVIDQATGMQTGTIPADERAVKLLDSGATPQRQFGGSDAQYGVLMEGIIARPDNWQHRGDNCAGAVNMAKYRAWLEKNYGITMEAAANEGNNGICQ